MGNYADNKDAGMFDTPKASAKTPAGQQSTQDIYNARGGYKGTGMSLKDFTQKGDFGASDDGGGSGSQSVRRRGSATQQRVGQDTRVRDDASSGTGGAAGASIGQAMSQAAGTPATQQASAQNPLWQGARQATDLASIQQRVLQSLTKPMQRGQ